MKKGFNYFLQVVNYAILKNCGLVIFIRGISIILIFFFNVRIHLQFDDFAALLLVLNVFLWKKWTCPKHVYAFYTINIHK